MFQSVSFDICKAVGTIFAVASYHCNNYIYNGIKEKKIGNFAIIKVVQANNHQADAYSK